MGYQALLFCPDEKTARTVTQVLSELDFAVVPCTEPFAAVKKMMAEHFDAIVVDCDNEQNATLLFKSARNAPNNQSALAVAVVEGQAGVAKAFRIGANLVLTKPINVEQAKGTLRVARGLLRKNESNKASTAAPTSAVTSAPPPPVPAKPVLVPNPSVSRPVPVAPPAKITASPVTPTLPAPITAAPITAAPTGIPSRKQTPQPAFAASAASNATESAASAESVMGGDSRVLPPPAAGKKPVAPEPTSRNPEIAAASSASLPATTSTGAASAAAPAREAKPTVSAPQESGELAAASLTTTPAATVADIAASPDGEPTLTFGGTIGTATETSTESASGGGSKKTLLIVAAVLVIAAAGYAAWTKYGSLVWTGSNPGTAVVRPATVAVPPAGATSSAASLAASVPVPATAELPNSNGSVTATGTNSSAATTISAADTGSSRPSETSTVTNSGAVSTKTAAAAVVPNKPATNPSTQPIVIKKDVSQPSSQPAAQPEAQPETPKASSGDAPMPGIMGITSADNSRGLPNLMNGANSAPTPILEAVTISQGVSQGLLIKKTSPAYPPNALRMRIEGPVELLATITKKGDISTVKVLSGDASLARSATLAVKQWKYKPYLLDGSPVEIQTQITVNFKLPPQ